MLSFVEAPAKIQDLPNSKIGQTNLNKNPASEVQVIEVQLSKVSSSSSCSSRNSVQAYGKQPSNQGSQQIHTFIKELIKKGNLPELYRLMRDQKKLIRINELHDGYGLIHHAALTNNVEIF
jgi:hypothetical protein